MLLYGLFPVGFEFLNFILFQTVCNDSPQETKRNLGTGAQKEVTLLVGKLKILLTEWIRGTEICKVSSLNWLHSICLLTGSLLQPLKNKIDRLSLYVQHSSGVAADMPPAFTGSGIHFSSSGFINPV